MPPKPSKLLSFILVTLFSTSNALQLVARSDSGARTVGQLSTDDAFRVIDSNKDGKLSVLELQEAASFTWNDVEASNRARITFNLAHPADFVLTYDIDGDGELSKEEFLEPMNELQLRSSSECKPISDRLDSCKTHETIKCSAYLNTAEHMCRLNHRNVIEQCILSSSCGSICNCIAQAERAAHGESVLVLQHPDGHEEYGSSLLVANSTFALGHHYPEKRLFFLFLGLIVAEILNIAIAAALISASEIQEATGREVGFMDFDVWDSGSSNPPPKCSVYVYWSTQCGAIGTGKARGCSHDGTRLYKNSCKDHFRYGSRGCGFLDLGCRSLCYAVNDEGCPCSYFDNWRQQDNTDFPGNDLEKLHVQKLSDCRSACASSPSCLAFVVPPSDGTEDQTNCYLKEKLGSFKKSTGTTSFIKVLSNAKTCPTSLVGDDFGIFDRRGQSEPVNALVPRIDDNGINNKAFPFDPTDITFVVIARFLQALYRQYWINREQVQRTSFETTLTAIGNRDLTPLNGEPVANAANPRWRVSDGWRAINVFRNLLNAAGNSNTPVADWLGRQPTSSSDNLERAAMPQALRDLFIANEQAINNGDLPWAGRDSRRTAYPGVNALHGGGSNLGYYQGGAIGPFPMEGAFVMATQLAGINWREMAQRNLRRPVFWLNAIVPRPPGDQGVPQCLRQYADGHEFDPQRSRIMGFMLRDGEAAGGPREGFYVVIDVDGEQDVNTNPDRNVFVFVVHTIDPHSRINVPNANNLRNLQYTQFNPSSSPDAAPRGPGADDPDNNRAAQQRFFAHAHAGYFPWRRISEFMNQDPASSTRVGFPGYVQIGSFHIYINSENENDNIHPRGKYLGDDNGGRKHDEL
ncbi:hypothetical protein VNI00_008715 [Paramarasmius palmivorus]|uniref:Calmodulin n=1 Tax=Paramarasmius palmivorus TaxID=297713 RepID=A0AAW0CT90_9AGAR